MRPVFIIAVAQLCCLVLAVRRSSTIPVVACCLLLHAVCCCMLSVVACCLLLAFTTTRSSVQLLPTSQLSDGAGVAKWNAWKALQKTPKLLAMSTYCHLLSQIHPAWHCPADPHTNEAAAPPTVLVRDHPLCAAFLRWVVLLPTHDCVLDYGFVLVP